MEIKDIYEKIENVEKFYGKELNEIEESAWINYLQNISKERFDRIIQYCFREKAYMPKLATIVEINKTLSEEKKEVINEKVDCKYCQGDGVFELEYEVDGRKYSVGARCVCKNGEKYPMFKTIRDYGILKPDYFGNNSIYKLKPYVLMLINERLKKEKNK